MTTAPVAPDYPAAGALLNEVAELAGGCFVPAAVPLAVPARSRAGIEAVLASLISPGDRVWSGCTGHFVAAVHAGDPSRRDGLRVARKAWGHPR